MRSIRVLILLSLVAMLTFAVTSTATAATGGRPLTTSLSGAEEIPGPGDPDGTGFAGITVNPGLGQVCFWLEVTGIDAAVAAHIHVGNAGVAGPVVRGLTAPASGSSSGCVEVSRELAKALVQDPSHYYVNVHNPAYPAGALRGQLGD